MPSFFPTNQFTTLLTKMTCGICYNILFDHPNHFPLDWTTFENDSKSEMLQEKEGKRPSFCKPLGHHSFMSLWQVPNKVSTN